MRVAEWNEAAAIAELSRRIARQFEEITSLRRTLGQCMGDLAQARAAVVRLPHLGKVS